jgi:hypothetical protein
MTSTSTLTGMRALPGLRARSTLILPVACSMGCQSIAGIVLDAKPGQGTWLKISSIEQLTKWVPASHR